MGDAMPKRAVEPFGQPYHSTKSWFTRQSIYCIGQAGLVDGRSEQKLK